MPVPTSCLLERGCTLVQALRSCKLVVYIVCQVTCDHQACAKTAQQALVWRSAACLCRLGIASYPHPQFCSGCGNALSSRYPAVDLAPEQRIIPGSTSSAIFRHPCGTVSILLVLNAHVPLIGTRAHAWRGSTLQHTVSCSWNGLRTSYSSHAFNFFGS
jgi:hypothetical protein